MSINTILDDGPTDSKFGLLKVRSMRGHARHVAPSSIILALLILH